MDDRTDADAYPWGQFYVFQWTEEVRERYKEYDGCYLGHYAQWFFWFFFTIGIFVVAGGVGMMIVKNLENNKPTDLKANAYGQSGTHDLGK